MTTVELLRLRFDDLRELYAACAAAAHEGRRSYMVLHGWLTEIALSLAQLERQVVEAENAKSSPSPSLLQSAARRSDAILAALAPADRMKMKVDGQRREDGAWLVSQAVDLGPIVARLTLVHLFLFLQIVAAAGLLTYAAREFTRFDPLTGLSRQQWAARARRAKSRRRSCGYWSSAAYSA
jgi:hypothetical protein